MYFCCSVQQDAAEGRSCPKAFRAGQCGEAACGAGPGGVQHSVVCAGVGSSEKKGPACDNA